MKSMVVMPVVLVAGFVLGRVSVGPSVTLQAASSTHAKLQTVQNTKPQTQNPQTPEELIPLNPGNQNPSSQGQQPGRQPQTGDCPVLIYKDGQLFQAPGQGQQPGGQGDPQELIPLTPYNGPAIPGFPTNPGPPTPLTPQPNSGERS